MEQRSSAFMVSAQRGVANGAGRWKVGRDGTRERQVMLAVTV